MAWEALCHFEDGILEGVCFCVGGFEVLVRR